MLVKDYFHNLALVNDVNEESLSVRLSLRVKNAHQVAKVISFMQNMDRIKLLAGKYDPGFRKKIADNLIHLSPEKEKIFAGM